MTKDPLKEFDIEPKVFEKMIQRAQNKIYKQLLKKTTKSEDLLRKIHKLMVHSYKNSKTSIFNTYYRLQDYIIKDIFDRHSDLHNF